MPESPARYQSQEQSPDSDRHYVPAPEELDLEIHGYDYQRTRFHEDNQAETIEALIVSTETDDTSESISLEPDTPDHTIKGIMDELKIIYNDQQNENSGAGTGSDSDQKV